MRSLYRIISVNLWKNISLYLTISVTYTCTRSLSYLKTILIYCIIEVSSALLMDLALVHESFEPCYTWCQNFTPYVLILMWLGWLHNPWMDQCAVDAIPQLDILSISHYWCYKTLVSVWIVPIGIIY